MVPGEAYALIDLRGIKVTVLETPPEVRSRAMVRVRFESGVTAGEEREIPSRRIAAPWQGKLVSRPERQAARQPTLHAPDRAPAVGDTVVRRGMADLIWTLESLDEVGRIGTIRSVIFETVTVLQAPVSDLQAVHPRNVPTVSLSHESEGPDRRQISATTRIRGLDELSARDALKPIKPERLIDEIMDNVLFSNGCLKAYQSKFALKVRGADLNAHLRDEIRRHGFIVPAYETDPIERIRVRVRGRFELTLDTRPSPEHPATITRLTFLRRRRSGGAPSRSRQAKRAA